MSATSDADAAKSEYVDAAATYNAKLVILENAQKAYDEALDAYNKHCAK